MLFNSLEFAIFFPVVFVLYWFVFAKYIKIQNLFLLVVSYFFYSFWDWRFLFLLMFSTGLDYYSGLKMSSVSSIKHKKIWFWLSITLNLGFLGVFKYYNFFIESFVECVTFFGYKPSIETLNIILPVGISFYTFHGLSYVIDIYKGRISAEKDFVDYAVFVSFFPLLVAGPIERATHLLPQIKKNRVFEYSKAVSGCRQILWGLIKKVVIADTCAEHVNTIFNQYDQLSGTTLVLGGILFAFQIYGDFSGYSDIALGTARLLGIELLRNFSFPYFSRDIAEFWRRWHISLSTWFRDYLYIPLGGSKGNGFTKIRNTFIIFLVSGFWHGANWTFVFWGLLNAIYFLPLLLSKSNRNNLDIVAKGKMFPTWREVLSISFTFALTVLAWIFFRASSLEMAFSYIGRIISEACHIPTLESLFSIVSDAYKYKIILLLIVLFVVVEWLGREGNYALEKIDAIKQRPLRWGIYIFLFMSMFYFAGNQQQFIYFQF